MFKDYKKEVTLTIIVQSAKTAAEADYRADNIINEITGKYFDDPEYEENKSGCIALYRPETLMVDIADLETVETDKYGNYSRQWAKVEIGDDRIIKDELVSLSN